MDIVNLIISLISGAVGGNIGGAAVSEKNLGAIANTILGLLGGGLGDFILQALGIISSTAVNGGTPAADLDISTILANIGVSGASGGILTAVIALIKDALQKQKK